MDAPPLQQREQPIYVLQKQPARAIIPKTATLLVLGIIFYLLILLNLSFLDLRASEESITKLISLIVVIIIVIIGIIISVKQAHRPYYFFKEYLLIDKKKILYNNITNATPKKDLFDKVFHTSSIIVQGKDTILFIPDQLNINNYLEQMIAYAKQKQVPLP